MTAKRQAFRFVFAIGIVSLFADFTYEGSRSIAGPYLAYLGASGAAVGVVAGLGELIGYALRMVSGRISDKTRRFWPITILGYIIQMLAVPLLALTGSWQAAALLIVAERAGKATRTPPRDVMLSHAGNIIGQGWVFGMHEALDQLGAMIGPLAVAAVLAHKGDYHTAFLMLLIPALITIALIIVARLLYPAPENLHAKTADVNTHNLSGHFWIYFTGAALVAASFPDFALMSYHFGKTGVVPAVWIPVFYSAAMGASGLGSLIFGRLFDRRGITILIPLTCITLLCVPLAFWGGFWGSCAGIVLWGLGMGVHESIIPAAVAGMVPQNRRASAYGVFTAGYGISWFLGSAAIGMLYDFSVFTLVIFSLIMGLTSLPFFWWLRSKG